MKNNMFRKSLVIGIIILFLGASVIPSISGEYKQEVKNLSLVKNQSALNSNLIAYWSFNDGTAKDNENDHDGVIYGNPLFDDSGGPDGSGCFELDGSDDYIDISDTSHFGFANQDVTLTAWVQIVDNANMYRNFIHLGATNAEEQICLQLTKARSELGGYDGKMFMAVRNGDPIAYAAMSIKNGDELPKNQWIFLAGVIDSSSKIIKLYLDGSYQESASYPDYDLTDANILALNIGRAPYGYSNTYHNSFIDEVRIYDKALSEDEIWDLWGGGSGSYIRFDDFEDYAIGEAPKAERGWSTDGITENQYIEACIDPLDPDNMVMKIHGSSLDPDKYCSLQQMYFGPPGSYVIHYRIYSPDLSMQATIYEDFAEHDTSGVANIHRNTARIAWFEGDLPIVHEFDPPIDASTTNWIEEEFTITADEVHLFHDDSINTVGGFRWPVEIGIESWHIEAFRKATQDFYIDDFWITEYGGNQPPVAEFTWTPSNPKPGETISFDASDSYDPDGYITLYEWDWDNDGDYDESHTSPTATHSWPSDGSYPVTLRVTDNASATDTITKTVYVGAVASIKSLNVKGGSVFRRGSLKDIVFRRGFDIPTFEVRIDGILQSDEKIVVYITNWKGQVHEQTAVKHSSQLYKTKWNWKSWMWWNIYGIYVGEYSAQAKIVKKSVRGAGAVISQSDEEEFYAVFTYAKDDCFVTTNYMFSTSPWGEIKFLNYGTSKLYLDLENSEKFKDMISLIKTETDERKAALTIRDWALLNHRQHPAYPNKEPQCLEYTWAMVEACRICSIPARQMSAVGDWNNGRGIYWGGDEGNYNPIFGHVFVEIKDRNGRWYHFDPAGFKDNNQIGSDEYAQIGVEFRPQISAKKGYWVTGANSINNRKVNGVDNVYDRYTFCADVTDIQFLNGPYNHGDTMKFKVIVKNTGSIDITKPIYITLYDKPVCIGVWGCHKLGNFHICDSLKAGTSVTSQTFSYKIPDHSPNWWFEFWCDRYLNAEAFYKINYNGYDYEIQTSSREEKIPGLCISLIQSIFVDGEERVLENATLVYLNQTDERVWERKIYDLDVPAGIETYAEYDYDEEYTRSVVSIENPDSVQHDYSFFFQVVGRGDTVYLPSVGNITTDISDVNIPVDHFIVFNELEGTDGNVSIYKFSMNATIHGIDFFEYDGVDGALLNVTLDMMLDPGSLQEVTVYYSEREGEGLSLDLINSGFGEEIVNNGDSLVNAKILQLDNCRVGEEMLVTVSLFNNGEKSEDVMLTLNVSKVTDSTPYEETFLYNGTKTVSVPAKTSKNAEFLVPVSTDTIRGVWNIYVKADNGCCAKNCVLVEDAFDFSCSQNISINEGMEFLFNASVKNTWNQIVHGATISIYLFDCFNSSDPLEVDIGDLQPYEEVTASWHLTTRYPGVLPVVVFVDSDDGGFDQTDAFVYPLGPVDLWIHSGAISVLPPQGTTEVPINFTLSNLGDLDSTDISIELTTPDNVSASPSTWNVYELPGWGEIVFDSVISFYVEEDFFVDIYAVDGEGNNATGSLLVTINNPPETPSRPDGPTSGKTGIEYIYITMTTDLDGDEIFYVFNWGDGNSTGLGPCESGKLVEANHTWYEQGKYEIRVRAMDEFGDESDWSDPLAVTMPRDKAFNFNFNLLSWLFERFPNAFPILRYLLGL